MGESYRMYGRNGKCKRVNFQNAEVKAIWRKEADGKRVLKYMSVLEQCSGTRSYCLLRSEAELAGNIYRRSEERSAASSFDFLCCILQ